MLRCYEMVLRPESKPDVREVNERLVELSDGDRDGSMEFVCECSHDDCTRDAVDEPRGV